MISHVSNAEVLRRAAQRSFSKQLLKQQLKLYRNIACLEDGDVLRDFTFCPGSLRPTTERYVRRVGRPKNEWATQVRERAYRVAAIAPPKILDVLLKDKVEFERRLEIYISA
eukprot:gnl/MRDRNA2_/MRDRNA2_74605_c0_seq2.p1 gnl/MRDRNA2_/MRDRNA2_74605_c0~~gnl/MRDRNA2_/MRDRNA2_74605_c0_seq2.p1  ORF type:complete len:112 (+),score=5.43 gnl/MRDRNA2_/MRDRNA2_74605_c0_seq2:340-675(+)